MTFEIFRLTDSEHGRGLVFEEYNERFGIYEGQVSRDGSGTIYKQWCYPQYNKEPRETAIPMGVRLGNRQEAIETLRYFLEQLNAPVEDGPDNDIPAWEQEQTGPNGLEDPDIPF